MLIMSLTPDLFQLILPIKWFKSSWFWDHMLFLKKDILLLIKVCYIVSTQQCYDSLAVTVYVSVNVVGKTVLRLGCRWWSLCILRYYIYFTSSVQDSERKYNIVMIASWTWNRCVVSVEEIINLFWWLLLSSINFILE